MVLLSLLLLDVFEIIFTLMHALESMDSLLCLYIVLFCLN